MDGHNNAKKTLRILIPYDYIIIKIFIFSLQACKDDKIISFKSEGPVITFKQKLKLHFIILKENK